MEIITKDSKKKAKGNWITCKYCSSQFKFPQDTDRVTWRGELFPCPFCHISYCILPERERGLRVVQDSYFDNDRNPKYMRELFTLMVEYAEGLIKKTFVSKETTYLQEDINVYARDAVSLLMEKYADPDFRITVSFGGFLGYKIKEAMFAKKTHSCAEETLNYRFKDGNFVEIEDTQIMELDRFLEEEHKVELYEYITQLIFQMENKCATARENRIRLTVLDAFLNRGEAFIDKFFSIWHRSTGKYITVKTLDLVRAELLYLYGEKSYGKILCDVQSEDAY